MESDLNMFDLLCEAFPKIDLRIIKATCLEHGDDVESAFSFLNSINDDDVDQENALPEVTTSSTNATTELEHGKCKESGTLADVSNLSGSISEISRASLEEIVEEAKNNKELVINLVKEVSDLRWEADQEKAAVLRAKSEAATSGEGSLQKAEELRKKIIQKKQDNLLRRAEIYGEKVVLATEARGLKLLLEQVKLQKERAVAALDEMKVRLQGCYQEAVEERLMAEEHGRIKEKSAQDILAAEEASMASVEEETRKLDMEAEACLQLKEFLSNNGSIIDSLQGEMCVLCEDVESFKRQVDDGLWSSISTASLPLNVNPEGPYSFRKCKTSSTSSSQELGQSFDALCSSSKQFKSRMSASSLSSQEIADSAVEQSNVSSRISASSLSSQEIADSAVEQSNVSSQGYEKGFQQGWRFGGDHHWLQSLMDASSLSHSDTVTGSMLDSVSHHARQNSDPLLCDSRDSATSDELNCQKLASSESLFGDTREEMSSNLTDVRSDFQEIHSSIDSSGMHNKLLLPSGRHSNGSWASSNGSGHGFIGPQDFDTPSHCSNRNAEILKFPNAPCAGDGWIFTPKQMEESYSSTSSSLIKVEADDYH